MLKRSVIAIALCLLMAAVAQAQPTVKNHMMVGPYAGYTLGFGDAFKDVDFFGGTASNSAGINFGGGFWYGLTDKMMLGGELFVQSYKYEIDYNDDEENPFLTDVSESETETNILGSLLYTMSYMQKAIFMLNAGAGMYGHGSGSDLGIFGGIMYHYMVAKALMVVFMPRLHFVFADDTVMLLQLAVAVQWWLGSTGAPIATR